MRLERSSSRPDRSTAVLVLATLALILEYHHRRLGLFPDPWSFFEWHVASVLFLLVVPVLVATLGLRFTWRELGFGLGEPRRWLLPAACVLAVMVPVAMWAGGLPEFRGRYPLFRAAGEHPSGLPTVRSR